MALKDWKKIVRTNRETVFRNQLRPKNYINISKSKLPYLVKVEWKVEIYNGDTYLRDKTYFETKSQALKFARAYMRTH